MEERKPPAGWTRRGPARKPLSRICGAKSIVAKLVEPRALDTATYQPTENGQSAEISGAGHFRIGEDRREPFLRIFREYRNRYRASAPEFSGSFRIGEDRREPFLRIFREYRNRSPLVALRGVQGAADFGPMMRSSNRWPRLDTTQARETSPISLVWAVIRVS